MEVINWGRKYPIQFAERFMGIQLLDFQKYVLLNTWTSDFAGWLMCRNAGKTTMAAIYTMLKSLLFPYHATYYLGNTGQQSKEIFTKLQKIAKNEIESFSGGTDFFVQEVRVLGTTGDGFNHNPASYHVELFNGSNINTLNSDIVNIKGKRANLVVFDQAAWMGQELIVQGSQFANQSSDFRLGGQIDLTEQPKNMPRQLLFCSSASDTQSEFYKKLRNYTMEMMMGNQHYFVCDLDADIIKTATRNGQAYPGLLSQDKIDNAIKENSQKAMRQLYNRFTSESHEGQILTRRHLLQHTKQYLPQFGNKKGNEQYLISWDSARLHDGSIITVAQLIDDPQIGWRVQLKNVFALVDPASRNKTPMRLPEQIAAFQKILLDFNGSDKGKLDYENIRGVLIDSGAGGQPYSICDNLVPDFEGADGRIHRGIIDRSHKLNETAQRNFPDAVDIVTMVDPRAHRNELYQALQDAIKLGVVSFPMEYDGKDYYITTKQIKKKGPDGKEALEQVEEMHELTDDEKISLMRFEILKTECITMCKYSNGTNVRFDYPPDKRNKMKDDELYSLGLICWKLMQLRRGQTLKARPQAVDLQRPLLVSEIDF